MKLLILPDDGLDPILGAIAAARKSIRIAIFRCDLTLVERALEAAVGRGVKVHALIAHTNCAGEKQLRKLELRLLGAGVTVSRTMDDLVRYHDKMLIVDERVLYVLAFNFTRLDARGSRSMGMVTRQPRLVAEAVKLFDADAARQPFSSSAADLVVSPFNARARLAKLIAAARRELLIYDPRVIDMAMLRLLGERLRAGVDIRIIGRRGRGAEVTTQRYAGKRLHLRAICRDQRELFIGSQSLRGLELDRRRELGLIVRHAPSIRRFRTVFEADWAATPAAVKAAEHQAMVDEPVPEAALA
jgi:phosphatidylserine/phosphatidylglycerophosphate/cardiolipin synthase-like enzyme